MRFRVSRYDDFTIATFASSQLRHIAPPSLCAYEYVEKDELWEERGYEEVRTYEDLVPKHVALSFAQNAALRVRSIGSPEIELHRFAINGEQVAVRLREDCNVLLLVYLHHVAAYMPRTSVMIEYVD